MPMHRTNLSFPHETMDQLRVIATHQQISLSALLRKVLTSAIPPLLAQVPTETQPASNVVNTHA